MHARRTTRGSPPRQRTVTMLVRLGVLAGAAACVSAPPQRRGWRAPAGEHERVHAARVRQEPVVRRLFRDAGVEYPTRLLLVAYKQERRLELWGYSRRRLRYVEVAAFPILAASGRLGPKRRAWDHQVPEGFYRVVLLNPTSLYHLSIKLDYPNASDRVLGDRGDPGGDIFIHGDDVSDGCIAVGDRAIEQLYLAVSDSRAAGYDVPVDIFPCRFFGTVCRATLQRDERTQPDLVPFWADLEEGFDLFVASRTLPAVAVDRSGRYSFARRASAAGASGPGPGASPP